MRPGSVPGSQCVVSGTQRVIWAGGRGASGGGDGQSSDHGGQEESDLFHGYSLSHWEDVGPGLIGP